MKARNVRMTINVVGQSKHTPLREAVMTAWVAGWYAGRNGERTDDGKHPAADKMERDFPDIVRACNCHDELVQALTGLLECLGAQGYFPEAGKTRTDAARAALASAAQSE